MSEPATIVKPAPNPEFPAILMRLENEIIEIVGRYEEKRSALIPIVRRFQDVEGYVSQQAIDATATILSLPVSVVESVVSFYTLLFRRPVGKYMLQVCRGMGCTINGAEEIHAYFREKLGIGHLETTEDGLFSYEEVECLAKCDKATCMQVNLEFVYSLTKADIDEMLIAMRAGTSEFKPLPQTAKPAGSWHVGQDTGKKSAGAVGVSSPNAPGGIGDRSGVEMLQRIVAQLPGVVARTRERLVQDAAHTEKSS